MEMIRRATVAPPLVAAVDVAGAGLVVVEGKRAGRQVLRRPTQSGGLARGRADRPADRKEISITLLDGMRSLLTLESE